MKTRSLLFVLVLAVILPAAAFAADIQRYPGAYRPDSRIEISSNAIYYSTLELYPRCHFVFADGITAANIDVQKLILHGMSTIDLTPIKALIPAKPKPAAPGQVGPAATTTPNNGTTGTAGEDGQSGAKGVDLTLSVNTLDATDGSLWIKTDGGQGNPGSPAGDGGKGSAGPWTCAHNNSGGNGGQGGRGGNGGKGGDTAVVKLKIGNNPTIISLPYAKTTPPKVAPSDAPAEAKTNGAIVVFGYPGKGGTGGAGGNGGSGGEGHDHIGGPWCPNTHSNPGSPGPQGASGSEGPVGDYTPVK